MLKKKYTKESHKCEDAVKKIENNKMITEAKIRKAAGKMKESIWEIDCSEGEWLVWLKDDYVQEGSRAQSFNVYADESYDHVKWEFSNVRKLKAEETP